MGADTTIFGPMSILLEQTRMLIGSTEFAVCGRPLPISIRIIKMASREQREDNGIPPEDHVLFLEIRVPDASEFSADLRVCGLEVGSHQVLRAESAAVANGIAALLLYLRDRTGRVPHAYFSWTEGNPVLYMIRYVLSGYGDVAPITREVLRLAEHNPARRPRIHAL